MTQGTQSCSDNLEGEGRQQGWSRGFRMKGTHVYLWSIHTDVHQKPSESRGLRLLSHSTRSDSLRPHGLQPAMGILQARILEWVAIPSSRASSPGSNPRVWLWYSDSLILTGLFTNTPFHLLLNDHLLLIPLDSRPCWTSQEDFFFSPQEDILMLSSLPYWNLSPLICQEL